MRNATCDDEMYWSPLICDSISMADCNGREGIYCRIPFPLLWLMLHDHASYVIRPNLCLSIIRVFAARDYKISSRKLNYTDHHITWKPFSKRQYLTRKLFLQIAVAYQHALIHFMFHLVVLDNSAFRVLRSHERKQK